MALKDLLVYVDHTEDSLIRLRLAADLAIRHGSRLTALFVREWNETNWIGASPPSSVWSRPPACTILTELKHRSMPPRIDCERSSPN